MKTKSDATAPMTGPAAGAAIPLTPLERQLLSALQGVDVFFNRPGEDSMDAFERVAAVFRKETGYLRPGKDCVIHDHEVRKIIWEKWVAEKLTAAREAINAATGAA